MGDGYYEQIVECKETSKPTVLRVSFIVLGIALILIFYPLIGFLVLIPSIGLYALANYVLIPRSKVSYEYDFWNDTIGIAVIYDKKQRKEKCSIDLSKVKAMTVHDSDGLTPYQITKRLAFISGLNNYRLYDIVYQDGKDTLLITLEPDEKMLRLVLPVVEARTRFG